jgi:hypothetical protein
VAFYAQPLSSTYPTGNSFLINEQTIDAIPPFDPDNDVFNWVLAHTVFDTTGHGGQHLGFWVIVWMQDSDVNGNPQLVTELPAHSLTQLPGTLSSLADADKISETYSNNVGFYKVAFHIFSTPPALLGAPPGTGAKPKATASIRLDPVLVSSHRVARGERVIVSTGVYAKDDSVPGITLLFYDGDPQDGGTLFDVERLSHVRADDRHAARVNFRSDACGRHKVFVVAGKATPLEQVRSSGTVVVDCGR